MIRQLQSAIFWARSLWAIEADDVCKARKMFDNFSIRHQNKQPYHRAFEATLLIREGKSDAALTIFNELAGELSNVVEDIDNIYVCLYAKYFANLILRDQKSDLVRVKARAIEPSRKIRRALPLPAVSVA